MGRNTTKPRHTLAGLCAESGTFRRAVLLFARLVPVLAISISIASGLGFTQDAAAQRSAVDQRILALDGARNMRDLGGYITEDGLTVRWGKVYRSDNLANLSRADMNDLRKRDITTVIDFRSVTERAMAETTWSGAAPKTLLLPIGGTAADWSASLARFLRTGDFAGDDIHQTFVEAYRTIPADATDEYRILFDTILDDDGAVLFHCTAGKDRTGIGAALILSALGVSRTTIMADFMLTNEAVDANHSAQEMASAFGARLQRDLEPESMFPLVGVEPLYLNTMFDSIEADYGSVDEYLKQGLGLSQEDLTALKRLLLVDATY